MPRITQPSNDYRFEPRQFDGVRIYWLWHEGDTTTLQGTTYEQYRCVSVFVSTVMNRVHDQWTFHTDEGAVLAQTGTSPVGDQIDPDDMPAQSSPDPAAVRNALPSSAEGDLSAEHPPAPVWTDIVPEDLRTSIVFGHCDDIVVWTAAESPVIDQVRNFQVHETTLRRQRAGLSNRTSTSQYSGPLYVYKINLKQQAQTVHKPNSVIERCAPMNVAWRATLNMNASAVATEMEQQFQWTSIWPSPATRYTVVTRSNQQNVPYNSIDAQRDQATKQISGRITISVAGTTISTPQQWHVRVFEVPNQMDTRHDVAGQAHRDPVNHGKAVGTGSTNWQFDRSRQEVATAWDTHGYTKGPLPWIGNGGTKFQSSSGELRIIEP